MMIDINTNELKEAAKYAVGGSVVSLVMAMFTPAAVILAAEAVVAAGAYAYIRKRNSKNANSENNEAKENT